MPFESKAQQRWAYATGQDFAKEWSDKTDFSSLPEKKTDSDPEETKKKSKKRSKKAFTQPQVEPNPQWDTPPELRENSLDQLTKDTQMARNAQAVRTPVFGNVPGTPGETLAGGGGMPGVAKPAAPIVQQGNATDAQGATPGAMAGNAPVPPASEASINIPEIGGADPIGEKGTKLARGLVDIALGAKTAGALCGSHLLPDNPPHQVQGAVERAIFGPSEDTSGAKTAGYDAQNRLREVWKRATADLIAVSPEELEGYGVKLASPPQWLPGYTPSTPGTTQVQPVPPGREISQAHQQLNQYVKRPNTPVPPVGQPNSRAMTIQHT